MNLTEMQYMQAKSSIEEYEEQHNIDAEHPRGRKPLPQRAAISQKIIMGGRKPMASVRAESVGGERDGGGTQAATSN